MREDIQSILYSQETLAQKVRQMGQKNFSGLCGKKSAFGQRAQRLRRIHERFDACY